VTRCRRGQFVNGGVEEREIVRVRRAFPIAFSDQQLATGAHRALQCAQSAFVVSVGMRRADTESGGEHAVRGHEVGDRHGMEPQALGQYPTAGALTSRGQRFQAGIDADTHDVVQLDQADEQLGVATSDIEHLVAGADLEETEGPIDLGFAYWIGEDVVAMGDDGESGAVHRIEPGIGPTRNTVRTITAHPPPPSPGRSS